MEKTSDYISGIALGLFLGVLVGFSGSPVVSSVVSALVTLVGGAILLKTGGQEGEAVRFMAKRAAGFGLAGALATFVALFARTNGLLEPSPSDLAEKWKNAGFEAREAASLASFELLGTTPKQLGRVGSGNGAGATPPRQSILMSDSHVGDCNALAKEKFPDDAEWLNAVALREGVWGDLLETLKGVPMAQQAEVVGWFWSLTCGEN